MSEPYVSDSFVFVCVCFQFRENVSAWVCFHEKKEAFKGFIWRVLHLKEEVSFLFSLVIPVLLAIANMKVHGGEFG